MHKNPSENEVAADIVDVAFQIHSELGPGLLETVYEVLMTKELETRGHVVQRQVAVPLTYRGVTFDVAFRADLIVDDLVLVELKCTEKLDNSHKKQLLTYLKLTNKRLGLLINFSEELIKDGITRTANNL